MKALSFKKAAKLAQKASRACVASNWQDFYKIVNFNMALLYKFEAQLSEEGYKNIYNIASCRWAIEQAILNRPAGTSMQAGAIAYVEDMQARMCFGAGK